MRLMVPQIEDGLGVIEGVIDRLWGASGMNESARTGAFSTISDEIPFTVKEAAKYLGVSPQAVYLWVERKQIPHLRVMGRNIRFLKSDLEPFRASFKQEMENE